MYVRLCGIHATHSKSFKIEKPHGFGDYLFLRMRTPTRFYLDGEAWDAEVDDVILYRRGDPQYYETVRDLPHADDYMFFDMSSEADQCFLNQLPLQYNRLFRFPSISSFMAVHEMICNEFISRSDWQKHSIDSLLRYFLIKLSESMSTDYTSCDHVMLEQFQALRQRIYKLPAGKWTVAGMADSVCLSPSYFQSLYKRFFHISCMEDVYSSRMNYAKELLTTTQLPIGEIAFKCGYESNIYFSRHFKRKVGMTPTEYQNFRMEYHPDGAEQHNRGALPLEGV